MKNNYTYATDKNNFGPVVSFAYSPRDRGGFIGALLGDADQTVIRGGFRMSYVNDEYIRSADNAAAGNPGPATSTSATPRATPMPTSASRMPRARRTTPPGARAKATTIATAPSATPPAESAIASAGT